MSRLNRKRLAAAIGLATLLSAGWASGASAIVNRYTQQQAPGFFYYFVQNPDALFEDQEPYYRPDRPVGYNRGWDRYRRPVPPPFGDED